jgi:hypothetical protein
MAHETLSLTIDSIHDQVHNTVRELCLAAARIRLIAAALEGTEELFSRSPTEDLRQAGAVAKAHAAGVIMQAIEVACKAERLEALAAIGEVAEN